MKDNKSFGKVQGAWPGLVGQNLVWFPARRLNVNQVKEGWETSKGAPPKGSAGTKIRRLEGAWSFQEIARRPE